MTHLPALSVSRLNDYENCPLKFRYRVIDRVPEPPSPAATKGTLVHSVLEHLYDKQPEERTVRIARDMVEPHWQQMLTTDPRLAQMEVPEGMDAWLDSAHRLVETYFEREDPRRLEPSRKNRERRITVELDSGLRFRGVIDRVDVAGNGDMRIVDYKTGKMPAPRFQKEALFQLRVYGLLLTKAEGRSPVQAQLIYLGSNDTLTYWSAESDNRKTEEQIRDIWSSIETSIAEGFEPRQSKLCDWCAFTSICPVFGGTPPKISEEGLTRLRSVSLN